MKYNQYIIFFPALSDASYYKPVWAFYFSLMPLPLFELSQKQGKHVSKKQLKQMVIHLHSPS